METRNPSAIESLPGAARWGFAAALILAAFYLVGVFWSPVMLIAPAVIFLAAAIGLRRGDAWSAHGSALFLVAMACGRTAWPETPRAVTLAVLSIAAAFAAILVWAGRSLAGRKPARRKPLWIALAILTLLFSLTVRSFVVPTGAMKDTILPGDCVFVRGWGAAPSRGDIIALRNPANPREVFVKRVVAAGGDRLRIRNKKLIVNGVAQDEPYVRIATPYIDDFRDNFPGEPNAPLPNGWGREIATHVMAGDLVVPPGKFFVLGDNRDVSLDSRYWGFVDRAGIIGRPVLIYFSADIPADAFSNPREPPAPILLTPGRIRWRRMFKPL